MKRNIGFMRGVNLGGWLSQCVYEEDHYESFITEKDVSTIAGWGADHVRLPIDYEVICNTDGTYNEKGFSYITNCIAWSRNCGLNMVLDLHRAEGYIFDDFENSNDFFYNEELQEKFINLWKELARRYGKDHDMLAFELLNEIVDPAVADRWNEIATRAIKAIREICPTINIIVGGINYNSVDALKRLSVPIDQNIVYNFHCYEPLVFTHQNAYWVKDMPNGFHIGYPLLGKDYCNVIPDREEPIIKDQFADQLLDSNFFEQFFSEAVSIAEEKGVCLYCGEYGVIDQADVAEANVWYQNIYRVFDKYGIGSAAWTYKGLDFGIIDKDGLQLPFDKNGCLM